jgi:hypothetical protein
MQLASRVFESEDIQSAIELCYERNWTDGLPVVPPTADAVERIVDYLRRDPAEAIGTVPPRDGVATIETVAINCVMAGCKPEYVPIVIAALQAMLEDKFNINGVQTTTHSCAPLVIVSGPAVKTLGFNTKECAFGHGCRASATIGRAIRLILWNLGGGFPGEPCKTTQGHPGYYSFCLAEDAEANPWEPLNVELGYRPEDTVVAVHAVAGPQVIETGAGYLPADTIVTILADSIASLGSSAICGGDMVMVLGPMAARNIANAGLSKSDLKRELMRRATRSVREIKRGPAIHESHPMHWKYQTDPNDDEARVPYIRSEEEIAILVAGGWGSGGGFSSLCEGWGANRGRPTHGRVVFPEPQRAHT